MLRKWNFSPNLLSPVAVAAVTIVATTAFAPNIAFAADGEEGSDSADALLDDSGEDKGSDRAADSEDSDKADDDKKADGTDGAAGTDGAGGTAGVAPAMPTVVEETIYAVEGKQHLVAGRFEIAPQFVQSVNDQFTTHTGGLLSAIYHVKENVAFELTAGAFINGVEESGYLGGRATDLTTEIRLKESLTPEHVKLYQFTWLATTDLQWSPFYGKVNVADALLGQFNIYFSVGAGAMGVQLENDQIANQFEEIPNPVQLTTTFGGGLRFYFSDWLGVRFEVRDYVTPLAVLKRDVPLTPNTTFDVTNLLLSQFGVSVVF